MRIENNKNDNYIKNIPSNLEELKYQEALKKVKKIKGFYTHFIVYFVVNLMIMIVNIQGLKEGETYFKFENFFTLFFWGLGLLTHGLSVFLPNFILGKNWENKKIEEIIAKEKQKQSQWK